MWVVEKGICMLSELVINCIALALSVQIPCWIRLSNTEIPSNVGTKLDPNVLPATFVGIASNVSIIQVYMHNTRQIRTIREADFKQTETN